MNSVSSHNWTLRGYTEQGKTWANEMYFAVNHAPGAGSTFWPAVPNPSTYDCPHLIHQTKNMLHYYCLYTVLCCNSNLYFVVYIKPYTIGLQGCIIATKIELLLITLLKRIKIYFHLKYFEKQLYCVQYEQKSLCLNTSTIKILGERSRN